MTNNTESKARSKYLPEDDKALAELVDTVCDALLVALEERKAKQAKGT